MNNIPEDILLLGLIVKTKPFLYADSTVTCTYEKYAEIENLESLRDSLQQSLNDLPEERKTDEVSRQYNDDIYFIDYIIQELKKAA